MARLAGAEAELHRAEFDKYAVPLLLLHGLWTAPWIWRRPASFLAHRGWNAWALSWSDEAASWSERLAQAERAAAELGRPVVIGHDLGGLIALSMENVRAAVAIAPLAGGTAHPLAGSVAARLARWRRAPFVPRDSEARRLLGLEAAALVPETSAWFAELEQLAPPPRSAAVPRLLLAGERDACLAPAGAAALEERFGAEVRVYPGAGHDLAYGGAWQAVTADLHRWLVHSLGESLLLLRGDEDLE